MNKAMQLFIVIVVFTTYSSTVYAEIQLTNPLAVDISKTYGFYIAQEHSLNEILKKHPSLIGRVLIAKKEFSIAYKSSIESMNRIMLKHDRTKWEKQNAKLKKQIQSSFNIEQVDKSQAEQYLELVIQRAKGNIESPIIETLLMFKSGYEKNPVLEFVEGYKYKYSSNGHSKAKGVEFTIEVPKTWKAQEGDRPNVVQKFVSQNGRGYKAIFLVLIKELKLRKNEKITEKDVSKILYSDDINNLLPIGATVLYRGKLTLENLPGLWVHYKVNMSRARNTVEMESIIYMIYYNNKIIHILGAVATSINGEQVENNNFKKYEKLFDLMLNSFVLTNIY